MAEFFILRRGMPLFLVACISTTGCTGIRLQDEHATHYLILGLGMISVPDGDQSGAHAVRTNILGASAAAGADKGLTLGYARKIRLAIPADAENTCLEISERAKGVMRVQTCDAFSREATIAHKLHCQ